eukprot:115803-Chlamydomonas_euryale.AAC.1
MAFAAWTSNRRGQVGVAGDSCHPLTRVWANPASCATPGGRPPILARVARYGPYPPPSPYVLYGG